MVTNSDRDIPGPSRDLRNYLLHQVKEKRKVPTLQPGDNVRVIKGLKTRYDISDNKSEEQTYETEVY